MKSDPAKPRACHHGQFRQRQDHRHPLAHGAQACERVVDRHPQRVHGCGNRRPERRQSARGDYDVRLVAGGCLCCVGELEFGKQLRDILRNFKPARLLIEPSGAGHAADIVDTLGVYESQKVLQLSSVICLGGQPRRARESSRSVRTTSGRRFNPPMHC